MAILLLVDGRRRHWLPARVAHVPGAARQKLPDLRGTDFAHLVLSGTTGQGRRCVAFAARADGRDLVLKVFHPRAVTKHAQLCGGSIARYECERNAAFQRVPELAPFVAAPIAFSSSSGAEMFLQERVLGEPLSAFLRDCSPWHHELLLADLRTVLDCAHHAGLFDLDLHPNNIIVRRQPDGAVHPVLFDFNKLPYHVQPPNLLFGLLVKVGLIGRRSRDRRQCKRLTRLVTERSRAGD